MSENKVINNGKNIIEVTREDISLSSGNGKDLIIYALDLNAGTQKFIDGGNGIDSLLIRGTASQLMILEEAVEIYNTMGIGAEFDFGQWLELNNYNRDLLDIKVINIEKIVLEEIPNTGPNLILAIDDHVANIGETFNLNVADNFSDPNFGDVLTFVAELVDGDALPPWLNIDPNTGILTGTPDQNNAGILEIKIIATDASGSQTSDIFLLEINIPPIAIDDNYVLIEDEYLSVTVPGILINEENEDNDVLVVSLVNDVSYGTLSLNPDGSFSYTPVENFSGIDSFSYVASDGKKVSNIATVTIFVESVADMPSLVVNEVATFENIITINVTAKLFDLDSSELLTIEASSVPNIVIVPTMVVDDNLDGTITTDFIIERGEGFNDPFTVNFTAIATETLNNDSASISINIIGGADGDMGTDDIVSILNGTDLVFFPDADDKSFSHLRSLLTSTSTSTVIEQVIEVADINDDGSVDIVSILNGTDLVFFPDADDKSFSHLRSLLTSTSTSTSTSTVIEQVIEVADINDDGSVDIVSILNGTDLVFFPDADDKSFSHLRSLLTSTSTSTVIEQVIGVADVNGDGNIGIVSTINGTDLVFFPDVDAASFTPLRPLLTSTGMVIEEVIEVADVNGDGNVDIVSIINGTDLVFFSDVSSASFTPLRPLLTSTGTIIEALGDLGNMDGDGGSGNDILIGTQGADIILGFGGNDLIDGLNGNDILIGNDGADIFRIDLSNDIGTKIIQDFMAEDDILRIINVEEQDGISGITIEDLDMANHFFEDDGAGNLKVIFENRGSLTLVGISYINVTSFTDLQETGVSIEVT